METPCQCHLDSADCSCQKHVGEHIVARVPKAWRAILLKAQGFLARQVGGSDMNSPTSNDFCRLPRLRSSAPQAVGQLPQRPRSQAA
mmetsp:Transcript_45504/g.97531  ORF Transcript_45504/g.97531 Transcript_45504/m.97531 type:complete len:87 (+) Transcript_45504:421-681(+)